MEMAEIPKNMNMEAQFTHAIIFAGETLAKMTNDFILPCLHRVVRVPV